MPKVFQGLFPRIVVIGQSRALTLPKLCVMVLDHMFQEYNLGAKVRYSRGQWTTAGTAIVHPLSLLRSQ